MTSAALGVPADIEDLLERLAPASPRSPRAERARAWLAHHGLPDPNEEAWRYTPLGELGTRLRAAVPAPRRTAAPGDAALTRLVELAGSHGGPRLCFVNGVIDPSLSDGPGASLTAGLWLGGAEDLRRRAGSTEEPADGFVALNWAAGSDVAAVFVEPGATHDVPVHVVHVAVGDQDPTVQHPRTVLRAGPGSRVHLIESFVGRPGPTFTNASTRLVVGKGAEVVHHRLQAEAPGAVHVGRTGVTLAESATVRATSIMTGADIARHALDVRFDGPDAHAALEGLYVPTGDQRHDSVVTVDHAASGGTSTQRFRGIVDGRARGSFSGHVVVRPGTVGNEADQSNRNLVLAPSAQADTRPWLEIFADDVRCTHGATVGRLDEDALFYLRSRGIPLSEGRAMLVAAFAAEIIDTLPATLRDRVVETFGTHPAEPSP